MMVREVDPKHSESACEQLWDLLSAYADGQCAPADAARIEEHLARCEACSLDLRFLRETAHLLAATPEVAPPPRLRESILAATVYRPTWSSRLREAARRLAPARGMGSLALAGSAAAILVAGYIALTIGRKPPVADTGGPGRPAVPAPVVAFRPHSDTTTSGPIASRAGVNVAPWVGIEHGPSVPPSIAPSQLVVARRPQNDLPFDVRPHAASPTIRVATVANIARRPHGYHPFSSRPRLGVALRARSHSTTLDDAAPMLQPERDLQPADMQITTADMNDMTPSDDMMDGMSPMAKTGIGVDPTAVAAPARTHIALASITSPSQSPVATELVTLADLRRRLRNRNADVLSQHQELHLHRSAELLNIVKSSF